MASEIKIDNGRLYTAGKKVLRLIQGTGVTLAPELDDIVDEMRVTVSASGLGGGLSSVFALAGGGTSVGATSLTVAAAPPFALFRLNAWIIIGEGTATAELRKLTATPVSPTLSVSALTYPHSTGDLVRVLYSGVVTTAMWGVACDGVTDDHDALQEAVRQAASAALWLDFQGKVHLVASPIILPANHRWLNWSIKLKSTYAPADTNNAAMMTQSGNIVSVASADPATDIITTATAHNLPANNIGVVFQGANLPAGLVAGRFYYPANRTTFTFTVSETSGGATVDITATGTGTAFCEVYASNAKSRLGPGLLECNLVAGAAGLLASVQQQTTWDEIRVNNALGTAGIQIKGQQADWRNVEVIGCTLGVIADNMSFLYVKDLDIEGVFTSAMKGINAGLINSHVVGYHIEPGASNPRTCNDFIGGCSSVFFDDVNISGFGTNDANWVGFDFGVAATTQCSYQIRVCRFPGSQPTAPLAIAVRDNFNVKTMKAFDDASGASCAGRISLLITGWIPASAGNFDDNGGLTIWGQGGREIRLGAQNNTLPMVDLIAGTALTGDMIRAKDTSGNIQFEVTKDAWLKVGAGAAVKKILSNTATFDPPSTIDGATWTTTVTVSGATVTNSVARASHSQITAAGWILYASVTSADTVTVVAFNKTGGTVDLASGTLRAVVEQF